MRAVKGFDGCIEYEAEKGECAVCFEPIGAEDPEWETPTLCPYHQHIADKERDK